MNSSLYKWWIAMTWKTMSTEEFSGIITYIWANLNKTTQTNKISSHETLEHVYRHSFEKLFTGNLFADCLLKTLCPSRSALRCSYLPLTQEGCYKFVCLGQTGRRLSYEKQTFAHGHPQRLLDHGCVAAF